MDFIGSGILGSIFGGLFRLAPEVLKWLDRKDERAHELSMFTLQTDLEKVRGTFKVEEKYVDHSIAAMDAIKAAMQDQQAAVAKSHQWVADISALVRPSITFAVFGLYCAVKISIMLYAVQAGSDWKEMFTTSWSADDFGMLNMIITFWFVGRSIERYQK